MQQSWIVNFANLPKVTKLWFNLVTYVVCSCEWAGKYLPCLICSGASSLFWFCCIEEFFKGHRSSGVKMSAPAALWSGPSQIVGAHRLTLRWRGAVERHTLSVFLKTSVSIWGYTGPELMAAKNVNGIIETVITWVSAVHRAKIHRATRFSLSQSFTRS